MADYAYKIDIKLDGRDIVSVDNFNISPNKITFLFGESGIGKSLLSKALYGLLDPHDLEINLNGLTYESYLSHEWTKSLKENGFFVFQEPSSHLNPLEKISTQLEEGALSKCRDDSEIFNYLFNGVSRDSVDEILKVFPKSFRPSGGEKQRILLAMAFKKLELLSSESNNSPRVFVFDEPTGSLDNSYRNLFLKLLFKKFREKKGFTVIIITHDYSIISEVNKSYSDLVSYVNYRELIRLGGKKVKLTEFIPTDYTSWLKNVENSGSTGAYGSPVLLMKSKFKIFDRELTIYRDETRTTPCSLIIRQGEMVYIKAPSGMGKTTLAKIIMGLYHAQKVSFELAGVEINECSPNSLWREKIWGKIGGMVFQHADESLNLSAKLKDVFKGLPVNNLTDDILRLKLEELFDYKHLDELMNKKVVYLSGGQKQKLNILRTLILDTDLIILDEPLNGLDFKSVKRVLDRIEKKQQDGTALLMISHNEEIFENIVKPDQIYYLDN